MRAIVLEKFGGLDSLVYKDIPEPEPKAGHVAIQIKAFGLNHAELHMRRGEWAEAAKVSGIECLGLVKSCPGGRIMRPTTCGTSKGTCVSPGRSVSYEWVAHELRGEACYDRSSIFFATDPDS